MKILIFSFLLTWCLYSIADLSQSSIAQVLPVSEQVASDMIKRITYLDQINTNHAPYYPILTHEFLNKRDYKIGCEVGVFTGGHAEFILAHSTIEKLYCVDQYMAIPTLPIVVEGFARNYWQACWDTMYYYAVEKLSIFGNRAQFIRMTATQAAAMISDNSLDFVFIDGDHSYAAVLEDCASYYNKVRSGGIISGDDYQIDNVCRALHYFFEQKKLSINIYEGQNRFWWVEKP